MWVTSLIAIPIGAASSATRQRSRVAACSFSIATRAVTSWAIACQPGRIRDGQAVRSRCTSVPSLRFPIARRYVPGLLSSIGTRAANRARNRSGTIRVAMSDPIASSAV